MPAPQRTPPQLDELSQPFWDAAALHRLVVQRCGACGKWQHPPSRRCQHCTRSDALAWQPVTGRGTLVAWTQVQQGLVYGFKECTPYLVLLVRLDEQDDLMMVSDTASTPIANWQPQEGARMQAWFEDVGGFTLPQFAPAGDTA